MIFVDSNIPMHLVGGPHANKDRAEELLRLVVEAREKLVTDAAVFQEILDHYLDVDRRDAIEPAWKALAGLVDEVIPVSLLHVELAQSILAEATGLSARAALHVAVMRNLGVERVVSFDAMYDQIKDLRRIF